MICCAISALSSYVHSRLNVKLYCLAILISCVQCWWCGVAVTHCVESTKLLYSMPGYYHTWIGDCLPACKPSWYEASQLDDLALYPPWDGKLSISFRAE